MRLRMRMSIRRTSMMMKARGDADDDNEDSEDSNDKDVG